jgi:AraC family transcriptional regulator, regulatory protein of adaptative response / DNA-3-methyladenine glycosylase II
MSHLSDPLSLAQAHQAFQTRDARFDGHFFIAVRNTKIYCRPVCKVKLPKLENCTFYQEAACAEQAGYRPCLRCRPELAPERDSKRFNTSLAEQAMALLRQDSAQGLSVADLAEKMGISARQLQRLFIEHIGLTPVAYGQTQRLLRAKQLLQDTHLPIQAVAEAAGFGSVRRLNELFQTQYRLTPSDIRKTSAQTNDQLQCQLAYRPPLAWTAMLHFLGKRAIRGLLHTSDTTYRRTVRIEHQGREYTGWLAAEQQADNNRLTITLSASLAPAIITVLARTRELFDLDADPALIEQQLGEIAQATPGLRLPGAFDPFEMVVRAILGQQITVAAATTLAGRVTAAFGTPIATPFPELTHCFPSPATVAALSPNQLGELGIISRRSAAIIRLADEMASGRLPLTTASVLTQPINDTLTQLQALPGIGEWTAHYIAMRALHWPDAFPAADLGIIKALGVTTPKAATTAAEAWRPWRAYAVMHLWN